MGIEDRRSKIEILDLGIEDRREIEFSISGIEDFLFMAEVLSVACVIFFGNNDQSSVMNHDGICTGIFTKVTCQSCDRPTNRGFSSSEIGTDLCYGLFQRGNKTVQAKNIKFCVGGPSCVGGGENHIHQYDVQLHIHQKTLSSAT